MRTVLLCVGCVGAVGALALAGACGVDVEVGYDGTGGGHGGATTASTGAPASATVGGSTATTAGGGGGVPAGGASTAASSTTAGSSGGPIVGSGTGGGAVLAPGFNLVGEWIDLNNKPRIDIVDPSTGQGTFVGSLGDVDDFGGYPVLNGDGTRVYGIGIASQPHVIVLTALDLTTGIWTEVPTQKQTQMYTLVGVTDAGDVIGAFQNGSDFDVDLVDTATGVGTSVGVLGDLSYWGTAIYDRQAHVVYVWGQNGASAGVLYSLDIDTHVSHAVPLSVGGPAAYFALGGVAPSGSILGASGNYPATVIVDAVDPTTALVTSQGALGDFTNLDVSSSVTYDASAGKVYATGAPSGMPGLYLATFDLATQVSTTVATAKGYLLAHR